LGYLKTIRALGSTISTPPHLILRSSNDVASKLAGVEAWHASNESIELSVIKRQPKDEDTFIDVLQSLRRGGKEASVAHFETLASRVMV